MIRRAALLLGFVVGVALPSPAAANPDPWLLWSRDTQFKDRQPARQWRTGRWAVREGPLDTRTECERMMADHHNSAARLLAEGYRVTSVVGLRWWRGNWTGQAGSAGATCACR